MGSLLDVRLVNVDGRIYRSTADLSSYGVPSHASGRHESTAAPIRTYGEVPDEEDCEGEDHVIEQEGDAFLVRMKVDNAVVGFLIGAKGATKGRLEQETGAKINITSKSRDPAANADIVIKSGTRHAAARAATRVAILLESVLQGNRLDYTHFVSIPLVSPELQAKFAALKSSILGDPAAAAAGIEDSLFVGAKQLHLTIAMLKLYTENRRQAAVQVLERLEGKIKARLNGSKLRVTLRRPELMNDDPAAAHVLYLGVEPIADENTAAPPGFETLRFICSDVVAAFDEAGLLLPKDSREVKLHATLMNTRHRVSDGTDRLGRPGQRRPFDARKLLDDSASFDFGEVALTQLELSQRGKINATTGYYHALARIQL